MSARTTTVIIALLLLIAANILMVYMAPPGFRGNREGFRSGSSASAGGAKSSYVPMGPFDGIALKSNQPNSPWRSAPDNEPLNGPAFELGPDSLFIFKNNQCKPECCGASASCDGGCVCTTVDQRKFINSRGGNRTSDSGF